jgi:acid phosphatase type 7
MLSKHIIYLTVPFSLIVLLITLIIASQAIKQPHTQPALAEMLPTLESAVITQLAEPEPAILIGAGDISVCGLQGDDRTAELVEKLLDQYPQAQVFTAGDNAQLNGEMFEYSDCFRRTWGRFLDRIHPSPGNHDWSTDEGSPYFFYFGARAGKFGLGYTSYDLGAWHIVSLNSNCSAVGCAVCDYRGCSDHSIQLEWLKRDLQQHEQLCTLLYWHHPLRSSGVVPIAQNSAPLWRAAANAGADVVINGHDHHYERFAPLDGDGNVDIANGIRSFIVGTGGAWLFDVGQPLPITEALDNSTMGVILFKLYSDSYEWEFHPVDGGSFRDSGSGLCH